MWPPFAERLSRAGFSAVTLNLSGSGVDDTGEFVYPERFGHNTFSAELQDLRRVVEALAGRALAVAAPPVVGLAGPLARRWYGGATYGRATPGSARWSPGPPISTVERWAARGARGVAGLRHAAGEKRPYRPDPSAVYRRARRHRAQRQALDIEAAAAARIAVPWLIVHGGRRRRGAACSRASGSRPRRRGPVPVHAGPGRRPHLRRRAPVAGPHAGARAGARRHPGVLRRGAALMPVALADLSGRVCVVTGATRGIGRATADGLAELGAHAGAGVPPAGGRRQGGRRAGRRWRAETGRRDGGPVVAARGSRGRRDHSRGLP